MNDHCWGGQKRGPEPRDQGENVVLASPGYVYGGTISLSLWEILVHEVCQRPLTSVVWVFWYRHFWIAPSLQYANIKEEGLGDMLESPLGKMSSQSIMCRAGCDQQVGSLLWEEGVNSGTGQKTSSARTRHSSLLSRSHAWKDSG